MPSNILTLTRKKEHESKGQPGWIQIEDQKFWTMEQPWNNDIPYHSCVQTGLYELVPWNSQRFGPCFVLLNEKLNVYFSKIAPNRPNNGRFKCLVFHRGNYPHNFEGCSGAGEKYNPAHDMITSTATTCKLVNSLIKTRGIRLLNIVNEE